MKKHSILLAVLTLISFNSFSSEKSDIKNVIKKFAKFDNTYDHENISKVIDNNFSIKMHSMKDQKKIDKIPLSAYINGLKAKKFGGNNKKLKIETVSIFKNYAQVNFSLTGEKISFKHFANLVELNGEWKILDIYSKIKVLSK